MTLRVFKFGGSTFLALTDYGRIAEYIRMRLASDTDKLVLVVSAMAGFTERLRGLAQQLNPVPSSEAYDALLPLADTLGANLLRVALEGCGVTATSLSGFQLGVRSDDNYSRARVMHVDPAPLARALERASVVVVPGGQAVDPDNRPTMLGKNSSDLTAILLAAALHRSECEIFSDVCGVYTADPNLVEDARLCPELPFDAVIALAASGAKVLHPKAVAAGRDSGVRIVCRANRDDYRVGTVVGTGPVPNAVVIDHRSQVLELDDASALARAEERLRAVDVPLLVVEHGGQPLLVVVGGFFDAVSFLRQAGIHARMRDAHLVSVFEGERAVHREIVPRNEAVQRGREWHRRFHGDAPAAPAVTPLASQAAVGDELLASLIPGHFATT
jgi:aspartate kinase